MVKLKIDGLVEPQGKKKCNRGVFDSPVCTGEGSGISI